MSFIFLGLSFCRLLAFCIALQFPSVNIFDIEDEEETVVVWTKVGQFSFFLSEFKIWSKLSEGIWKIYLPSINIVHHLFIVNLCLKENAHIIIQISNSYICPKVNKVITKELRDFYFNTSFLITSNCIFSCNMCWTNAVTFYTGGFHLTPYSFKHLNINVTKFRTLPNDISKNLTSNIIYRVERQIT